MKVRSLRLFFRLFSDTFHPVPLGQRRRFGPAPTEEAAPPQLAQPSPSAYPRPQTESPGKRGRDDSPSAGDPKGKPLTR
jgi:splicing factor 1